MVLYFCDQYTLLVAVAALYGFSNFLFGPPANALIADLVPEEKRITAYAMLRLAINAGFAAGPMVAGLLFLYSPLLIFAGDAATTLAFAVLAFFSLPHGLRTIKGRVSSPKVILKSWTEALDDVLANKAYAQFLLACLLMGIAFSQVFNLLALTTKNFGISPSIYGVIMGFNGALIMLIEVPITHWLKRFSPARVLCTGYVLIALGCIACGIATNTVSFFVAMGVFTLGEIVALPIGMAYSSNLAPEALRGRYFGFRGMTWALSGLIGSIGLWGYGIMGAYWWHLSGLIGLLGAIAIAIPLRSKSSCN